jgi:predicted RNase H-like HicB family nuclease
MGAAEAYLENVLSELQRLKGLAEKALAQVDDAAFFHLPGEEENSLAIVVKHMAGNMRSRWLDFLTTDGEKPDRHRDREFLVAEGDTREELMRRWEEGWGLVLGAIQPLAGEQLLAMVKIRGESHTALQAIQRQLSHYAYHVGQLVFLARHLAGQEWKSLSIPRGGSAAFNREPAAYRGLR